MDNKSKNTIVIKAGWFSKILLGGLAVLLIVAAGFIGTDVEQYDPNSAYILPAIVFGMALLVIWVMFKYLGSAKIENGQVFEYNLLGSETERWYIKDFDYWFESEHKTQYGTTYKLNLYGKNNKKTLAHPPIRSFDYEMVKAYLVENLPENTDELKRKKLKTQKIGSYVSLVVAIGCLSGFGYFFSQKDKNFTRTELVNIKGQIASELDIQLEGDNPHINFRLMSYSNLKFHIGSVWIERSHAKSIRKNIKQGSQVEIMVEPEDLKDALDGEQNLVSVCSFSDGKYEYLSLADYNEAMRVNNLWGLGVFLVMGTLFSLLAFRTLIKNRKGEVVE